MRVRDIDKVELVKQTAIELIVKGGLEGFSMNKLAKACKISVATLYIYYKDRDDLIIKIATEEGKLMGRAIITDFDPEMSFEQGLRKQWENRFRYMLAHPDIAFFFEQIRTSSYHTEFLDSFRAEFVPAVSKFMNNVISRGEINPVSFEVYWSVAFAPLYNLLRFHFEGKSKGGEPFVLTDDTVWQTFSLVVKALKK